LPIAFLVVLIFGIFSLQITLGDNPLLVGLYGLRSYLLPFPVIFIMGENLDDEDLIQLGKCTLWLLLPTCLLAVGQYLSPSGSFLNRGAYTGGRQIGYIGSTVRASGTFSFAVGLVEYATLAGSFIFYAMVRENFAKKWLVWASALALVIIIPTTGQRTLVVQLLALVLCAALSALMGVSQFGKVLRVIAPLLIVFFLASQLPVFNDAMHSMTERFKGANAVEGGSEQAAFVDRTITPLINAVDEASSTGNLMGIGLGRGALAVQAFLTGSPAGVTGEYEFSHELMEMGSVAGAAFWLLKLFLAIMIFGQALTRARGGDPLALLIYPLVFVTLVFALLEQPTLQGFMVISMAFCIAAAKQSVKAMVPVSGKIPRQQLALERLRLRRQEFRRRRVHPG